MYRLVRKKGELLIIKDRYCKNKTILKKVSYIKSRKHIFARTTTTYSRGRFVTILDMNTTKYLSKIYKARFPNIGNIDLIIPYKYEFDQEAMNYALEFINNCSEFDLMIEHDRECIGFILLEEYIKKTQGTLSQVECSFETLCLLDSSDIETKELAKCIVLLSNYSQYEKILLLNPIKSSFLTQHHIQKLHIDIQRYFRQRAINYIKTKHDTTLKKYNITIS
jgi:hypothetical protein